MATPDEYLAKLSTLQRTEFDRIKATVHQQAPRAELTMSYGLPTFKLNNMVLLHFGAFQNHMSIFPGAAPIAELAKMLSDYRTAKGTIQFTAEKPLPKQLLQDIIELCVARASPTQSR